MAVVSHKGKFFMVHLLLVFNSCIYMVLADSTPLVTVTDIDVEPTVEHKPENSEAPDALKLQLLQLEKMEELMNKLNELISRLDLHFPESSKMGYSVDNKKQDTVQNVEFDAGEGEVRGFADNKIVGANSEPTLEDGENKGAVSVTKFSPFWSERFQFVFAVKLGSNPTSINVLPNRDFEGFSKYVAVGDDQGRVYLLARNGDVMVQFDTLSKSPVTAMVSFISVYKNESIVVTGHEDGIILMHRVWEDSSGDDWNSLRMENIVRFDTPEDGDGLSPVTILEVHHVGQRRYILSTDLSGKIRVFRDNGTVYGLASPSSRPLAFLKQRLLFLTETGAGSLDLRTMKIRETGCEGLNSSVVKSYVFDAAERSKAYGFTSEGDLIHVLLLGDIMNFKCRVRSKKKFDMGEPVSFQAIKGYLLVGNEDKIFVYNVSSQHYVRAGGPKYLFSAGYDGIISSFLYQQQSGNGEKRRVRPIVASNHERLVILSLGDGYVAMYRCNLPVFRNEFNTMQWTSPVLFFILFLFGSWHFFAHKKEALTSWGPDDPFSSTSVTSGAPLGSGAGDRSFTDSSRNADVAELRGTTDIRGTTRRYVSPPQYPGGAVNSYRSGSNDTNALSTSVEPNFLKNQDLKFRGPNIENSGFPKRRESLFGSSQVVDEKS